MNGAIPFTIRGASGGDAEFLAWAILVASRGHLARGWFDIALDKPQSDCLLFLKRLTLARLRSRWHYSRFWVAECESQRVAALAAFDAAATYALSPPAVAEVAQDLGFSRTEQAQIWRRGAYLFTCTERPIRNCWVVESIATLPSHRRRGYTAALLERAIAEGRAAGLALAEITVLIGNESAERAYEKAGFELVSERRDPLFEACSGAAGQRRFARAI